MDEAIEQAALAMRKAWNSPHPQSHQEWTEHLARAAIKAYLERMPEVTFHHASSGHSLGVGGRIEYGTAYFLVKKPEQEGGG